MAGHSRRVSNSSLPPGQPDSWLLAALQGFVALGGLAETNPPVPVVLMQPWMNRVRTGRTPLTRTVRGSGPLPPNHPESTHGVSYCATARVGAHSVAARGLAVPTLASTYNRSAARPAISALGLASSASFRFSPQQAATRSRATQCRSHERQQAIAAQLEHVGGRRHPSACGPRGPSRRVRTPGTGFGELPYEAQQTRA